MIRTIFAIPMFFGTTGMLVFACSAGSHPEGGTPADGGIDARGTSPGAGADAGSDGDDSTDEAPSSPPLAQLRVAQLSPDLGPVDLCVAPHGTTVFRGPLLAELAASLGDDAGTDAAPPGLAYPQVSAYLSLDEGTYDVRLVAAGASTCSLPAIEAGTAAFPGTPDWTDLPPVAFNTYTTLLIAGDWQVAGADASLTLTLLPDDAVLAGPAAVLRAVNAVPSWPAADFGLGTFAIDWTPVLVGVPFAAASAHAGADDGVVDANGYLPIPTEVAQAMGARPSSRDAGVAVAVASSVEIDLGSIATLLAIGGKTGDSTHPPALLLCTDNQPSGGLLSDCSVSP
jgi:hypothetical protein